MLWFLQFQFVAYIQYLSLTVEFQKLSEPSDSRRQNLLDTYLSRHAPARVDLTKQPVIAFEKLCNWFSLVASKESFILSKFIIVVTHVKYDMYGPTRDRRFTSVHLVKGELRRQNIARETGCSLSRFYLLRLYQGRH